MGATEHSWRYSEYNEQLYERTENNAMHLLLIRIVCV